MNLELDLQIACDPMGLPEARLFRQWAGLALRDHRDEAEITVRLVDEPESTELNHRYRGKNRPTNVLSFPADVPEHIDLPLLGDLIICRQVVCREAQEQQKAELDHWAHLVIHGTLHLLGYDHIDDRDAQQMETLEIALLAELNIDNPYR